MVNATFNKENQEFNNKNSNETAQKAVVPMEDFEIEEFSKNQNAQNTARDTKTTVHQLKSRYGRELNLTTVSKALANNLPKHFLWKLGIPERAELVRNTSHQC